MRSHRPRRVWVALLLGSAFPGVGHVYAGAPWRGLVEVAALLGVVIPLGPLMLLPFLGSPLGILAGHALRFGVMFLVTLDGALVARRRRDVPPARWNRGWVLALCAAVVFVALLVVPRELAAAYPIRILKIPTSSMEPSLSPGDHVIADMRPAAVRPLELGELVVFRDPDNPRVWFTKRVAGLPGQTVAVVAGRLQLDGSAVGSAGADGATIERLGGRSFEIEPCPRIACDWGPERVPDGSVFLLGDSRSTSKDSRHFGFVRQEAVVGRVLGIVWTAGFEPGKRRWSDLGKRM